jgi:hypothetical protein
MPSSFSWLIPNPAPQPDPAVFEVQILTQQFYHEVKYREEFDHYCQWYRATATKHQQELNKMRGDINLFSWFCRRSGSR